MTTLIGTFIFRNEGDGCLTSKYLHVDSEPFVECCKRIKKPIDILETNAAESIEGYSGVYRSVWLEGSTRSVQIGNGQLEISLPVSGRFDLRWRSREQTKYHGVGMLVDGMLVGAYWKA